MKKPDSVIFDWDNTLVDTWNIIFRSLEKTFIKMDMQPMSFDEVKGGSRGIHGSLRDSFPRIFGDEWQEAREHYYSAFRDVHLQELQIINGAVDVLDHLHKNNIHCSIISNKTGKYLRQEVDHLQWNHYFSNIIGAGDMSNDKPAPDGVYEVLKNSPVNHNSTSPINHDIWFIGDSDTDMQIAKNAKIRALRFGKTNDNESCNIEIADHHHLLKILILKDKGKI